MPPPRRDAVIAGIAGGTCFGIVGAVLLGVSEWASWPWAGVIGVLAGAFFGALFGPSLSRALREETAAVLTTNGAGTTWTRTGG